MALGATGDVLRQGAVAMNEEPDHEIARQAFPPNLKTVEILLANDPENENFLFMLCQGYAAYTYLFVEDDIDVADGAGEVERVREMKERASALYLRAQAYGARILGPELTATIEKGDMEQVRTALAAVEKETAPALFWYSFSWVGRINMDQSNPERIGELPRVELLMNRVSELEPGYHFGLPQLTAGAIYTSRAPMYGGDMEKGKALLDAGIASSQGKFLLGKFLLARYYAVQVQDTKLFCTMLEEVASAPADELPEQGLMNGVTKRWAARWLARAGDLFLDLDGGCTAPAGEEDNELGGTDDLL